MYHRGTPSFREAMGKIDSMVGAGQGFPGEAGVYFARNKVTLWLNALKLVKRNDLLLIPVGCVMYMCYKMYLFSLFCF